MKRLHIAGYKAAGGFTIVEMLVGLGIFLLLGLSANFLMNAALTQFARGFSFNQAAEDSRAVMDQIVRKLEPSGETPELVTLSGTNLTNASTTYAMGIRFHRMLPGFYQLTGPVSRTNGKISFTATNATQLEIQHNSSVSAPITNTYLFGQDSPTTGDRMVVMNETLYYETITNGSSRGRKPGRGILSVSGSSGTTNKSQTVRITSATGRSLVCSNTVYFAREAAFLAVDVSSGGVTRRELRYYDRASSLTNYNVIVRYLDASPVETDGSGTTILPFSLDGTMSPTALMFNAPIKITDYARRLGSRKSKDEFSSFVRTRMAILRKDYIEIPWYKTDSTN